MRIRVLFFGLARELTGFGQEQLELPEGRRIADLRRDYVRRFPRLGEISASLLAALNQEVARDETPLHDGDEVAFLPPVSGGSSGDFFRLTRDVIPTARLAEQLKAAEDGAVVIFEGIVRDHLGGRKTRYLEYEAYEPMAVRKMQEIGWAARKQYPIDRIGIIHRLGRIEIGETSVAIIVASPHRHAAFGACHFAIDRLKQTVPIWKKEYFEDGAVWADGEGMGTVLMTSEG
jgi:molybdopterin converting factor subunit 1